MELCFLFEFPDLESLNQRFNQLFFTRKKRLKFCNLYFENFVLLHDSDETIEMMDTII